MIEGDNNESRNASNASDLEVHDADSQWVNEPGGSNEVIVFMQKCMG